MKKFLLCVISLVLVCSLCGCNSSDYNRAQELCEKGNYEDALDIFEELGDYEDSNEMVVSCNYEIAKLLFEEGTYEDALDIFEALGDYKDSAALFSSCLYEWLALETCETLQNMCKDPSSFTLYDDIYIYESEDIGAILYIDYGAKNSYGTMKRGLAIFDMNGYVGD